MPKSNMIDGTLYIEIQFGSGNLGGGIVLTVIFQVLPLPFIKPA